MTEPSEPFRSERVVGPYDTDKSRAFLERYESAFAQLGAPPTAVFELGILRGGSLRYWRDRFPSATIAGLDWVPVHVSDPSGRIRVYTGAQQDTELLDRIGEECAPQGFDVIIDDASHVGRFTAVSFWHLFEHHLRPGGIFVIEDWGTGYWSSYADGRRFRGRLGPPKPLLLDVAADRVAGRVDKVLRRVESRLSRPMRSHQAGLVGLVKQLIDLTAAPDIAREAPEATDGLPVLDRMWVFPGQVFLFKGG